MDDDATTMDETTIRDNLKNARNTLGYTQAQMADRIGISVTAYQKIESGKTRIINEHFTKCTGPLGLSLSELVNGFKPVRDADSMLSDIKESYGMRLREQESGFVSSLQEKEKEIIRLQEIIKDKEDTIATQKLLISHLLKRLDEVGG